MTMNNTPYDKSRHESFWRTGVANVNPEFELFKKLVPRLNYSKDLKLTSAGSCFAQHIGKWLTANQYDYIRSQINSVEISSFAFGNIYTPAALTQWLLKSEKELAEFSIFFNEDNGRFYDLLFANAGAGGYSSISEIKEFRKKVLAEAKSNLGKADCFIFTLGLIESWVDANGICYPVCPGAKFGSFDPNKYSLKVFSYNEIYRDVTLMLEEVKKINSNIHFILTVSPVPLTATATDQHILIANTYSKSVLRAVAGAISESRSDINYFPSFELITTPLKNDFRFLENRRTVSKEGVDFVMKHWADALASPMVTASDDTNYEVDCDEEMLESIAKSKNQDTSLDSIKLLTLIGDSHFSKLARSLEKLGIEFSGGMVMNGSGFAQQKFLLTHDADIFVPLESAASRNLWQKITNNLQFISEKNLLNRSCVITNIGHQTHQSVAMFLEWMQSNRTESISKISIQDFLDFFNEKLNQQLSIVFSLKNQGHRVIVVSDTPFWQYFEESSHLHPIARAYMDAMEYLFQELGFEYLHAAKLFNEEITNPLDYTSDLVYSDGTPDYFHGGQNYYDWLAVKLLEII